jgi:NAD+ synthase (glutamine-hydrolysing)
VDFTSAYDQGFVRVAACTSVTAIADPLANAASVLEQARELDADGVRVAVFPELALTGYAVDDLFLQEVVLDQVEEALAQIAAASAVTFGRDS